MHKVQPRSAVLRRISHGIAGALSELLPPPERAYDLAALTSDERARLYDLAGLDPVRRGQYEARLRDAGGVAA